MLHRLRARQDHLDALLPSWSTSPEQVEALLEDVLLDNLRDLGLLEHFMRDIEHRVLRVNDTLNEVEVHWDVFAVAHNGNVSCIWLDVVALLLGLEKIEWCTTTEWILRVSDASNDIRILWDVFAMVHDEDTLHIKLGVVALLLGLEKIEWHTTTEQTLRVRDASNDIRILWDVFATIHDEDVSHVKLDIVALLLGLEKIEWCTATERILGVSDASKKVRVFWDDIFAIVHDEDMVHIKFDVVVLLGLEKIECCAVTEHQYTCWLCLIVTHHLGM